MKSLNITAMKGSVASPDATETSKEFRLRFHGVASHIKRRYATPRSEVERTRAYTVWRKVRTGTITGAVVKSIERDNAKWFKVFDRKARDNQLEKFTRKSSRKFTVLMRMPDESWAPAWIHKDKPKSFHSEADAEAAITRYLEACALAVKENRMKDFPTRSHFKIEELKP